MARMELSTKRLRSEFVRKIAELSGQNVYQCYQCGKCSAGCPMASAMDILPNQVIRLIQLGGNEALVNVKTVWLCASCFTCTTRCPKGVDLARIMEAVRLINLRKNKDYVGPSQLPKDIIADLPPIAMVSGFRKLTS
jgi:heterodisulfide reductase subunit C2